MRLHVSVALIEGVIGLFTKYCYHIEECEIAIPLNVPTDGSVQSLVFQDLIRALKLNGSIGRFMGPSICDTVDTMLASVQEEIEDDDLTFKLRTARQLIIACKDEQIEYQQALKSAGFDDETEARLKELGYL